MKLKTCLLLIPGLLLAACGGGHGDNAGDSLTHVAVVATRAPDYGSGAISLIDTTAPFTARNGLDSTISDIAVRADGDHYFVFKRYGSNQIARYDAADPATPVWTYSTNDSDGEQSNPYDLIVASPTKAYLLRYGSGTLWIVNPSAGSEANFKTGEIDLSAYDSDGVPEMAAGLIKNGKLYVLMQRLQNYDATQDGYVAVIDTATDTEVDTGKGSDGLKGIELPVFNPSAIVAVPGTDTLLISASGAYGSYPDYVPPYNGGLVRLDTDSDTATLALDDGDADTHAYGQFDALAVVDAHRAYFVGSNGYGDTDQTLYRIDPGATTIAPVAVNDFANRDLGALAVDPDGQLWVARTSDAAPGLSVLGFDGSQETVNKALIDTVLTPINIDFGEVPTE
ncbi:hypothetical protein [Solimonas terrae]|uniref:Uncharacterized protein n=1 Tax=Solimonas terrae TaxID=1396819 RepID=A0A6M2BWK7_9GAMM|nr:hypothetical protein [Solimonas terrae]NGY06359.1 hypothetical protein [Solimonas terrae]